MGCDYYRLKGGALAHFSDSDDEFVCLCTFPHNDGEVLEYERLQSLSLLGAVVALAEHGHYQDKDYVFIPGDVPDWILGVVRKMGASDA